MAAIVLFIIRQPTNRQSFKKVTYPFERLELNIWHIGCVATMNLGKGKETFLLVNSIKIVSNVHIYLHNCTICPRDLYDIKCNNLHSNL